MEIEDIEYNNITYIGEKLQIEAIRHEKLNTYEQFIWEDIRKLKRALNEEKGEDKK